MNLNYQLKAMLAVAKASFKSMLRSPSAVVFSIAFPLIFIIAFGFIGGGSSKFEVAIYPNSDTLNPVYQGLTKFPALKIINKLSNSEIKKELEKGSLEGAINIQKSADSSTTYIFDLESSVAAGEQAKMLSMVLSQFVDKQNLNETANLHRLAAFNQKMVSGRAYKTIDFILPGQLGFSILSSGVFGTAFVFINLRQTLVLKRFFATPIQRPFIILGEAIARLGFTMLGTLLILLIGNFAFGFTLVHGFQTVLAMLLVSALALIVFMGFGFLVSGIAKNESAVPPIANIITMPQFLLAGTFFSVSNFPGWLQIISKALPLTYLNSALRKIAFEGVGIFDLGKEIGIIALWGIIVYFFAVRFFKWE